MVIIFLKRFKLNFQVHLTISICIIEGLIDNYEIDFTNNLQYDYRYRRYYKTTHKLRLEYLLPPHCRDDPFPYKIWLCSDV